jgi:hypothetical protein
VQCRIIPRQKNKKEKKRKEKKLHSTLYSALTVGAPADAHAVPQPRGAQQLVDDVRGSVQLVPAQAVALQAEFVRKGSKQVFHVMGFQGLKPGGFEAAGQPNATGTLNLNPKH